MPELPARSRRIVGLALVSSAAFLVVMSILVYAGLMPLDADIRGVVAGVLGSVAMVDLLLGFWFYRSSLQA